VKAARPNDDSAAGAGSGGLVPVTRFAGRPADWAGAVVRAAILPGTPAVRACDDEIAVGLPGLHEASDATRPPVKTRYVAMIRPRWRARMLITPAG
jgi:hypothetical protein